MDSIIRKKYKPVNLAHLNQAGGLPQSNNDNNNTSIDSPDRAVRPSTVAYDALQQNCILNLQKTSLLLDQCGTRNPATAQEQSAKSNIDKWRSFGLDTSSYLPSGGDPPQATAAPTASNANHTLQHNTPMATIRQKLSEITEKVQSAQEAQRCAPPRKEFHKGNNKKNWAKKKKTEGKETGKRAREDATSNSVAENSAPEETNPAEGGVEVVPSGKRKKNKAAKKDKTVPNPPPRTLFQFQAYTMDGGTQKLSDMNVPYEELHSTDVLFDDVEAVLNDPDRIQAPPLFVGVLVENGETEKAVVSNFSLSADSAGKTAFPLHVKPTEAHTHVQHVVLRWKETVYVVGSKVGLDFLLRVLQELPGVELVTFNATTLLLPLVAATGNNLRTSCVSDVRTMAWLAHMKTADADGEVEIHNFGSVFQCCLPRSANTAASLTLSPDPLQVVVRHVYHLCPVYRSLYGQLGMKGLLQVFLKQEKRIALLLVVMKYNGVSVRAKEVNAFRENCMKQMEKWRSKACAAVPELEKFNIQSSDQVRTAIYDVLRLGAHLKIDDVTITKGGKLSTAEDILKRLAAHHPFPQYVLHYRRAAKIVQTYIDGMMSYAEPYTPSSVDAEGEVGSDSADVFEEHELTAPTVGEGWLKLHPNFLQEGTDTGRLSCVAPNLQSLPRSSVMEGDPTDGEDGEQSAQVVMAFRNCFMAPPGWVYLSVDFQQIELRVLAHLCADAALVNALSHATDIHRAIAEKIFGRAVTQEERTLAKRVVFGILYGAGPQLLASQSNISVERAQSIAGQFRAAYPHIESYHQRVLEQGKADGYVRSISGRLRSLPDLHSSHMVKRSYAERQAFNTVIQGSAADVMKAAMLAVEREVLQVWPLEVQLCIQIHDEMIFCVQRKSLATVLPVITKAMQTATSLLVPLPVTAKFGKSLGSLTEWSVDHELGLGLDDF
ncbi:DNA polymerase family A, putative [Angomonas deanei]|uniref:DNA-directed DNA polymerase n=1 Tax=Angomonas deanei TaxID=59799 RepID=A0A7G2CIS1_9TRYP|nr:DNA polymerase family A, putative [Angomonas deanei]